MGRIILFFICSVFCVQASEFSKWQRQESQRMSQDVETCLGILVKEGKNDAEENLEETFFVQLLLGDFGNYEQLLAQYKVPPLSLYIEKQNMHQSAALSYRFGRFAYTLGLKNIAKAIFEAVSDGERSEIDAALGILAAYDEGDVTKALDYFDSVERYSLCSAAILRYISAPAEEKEEYAQKIKEASYLSLYCFDFDWFIANILDYCKSFKEIESLLWRKTKQGDHKAQMHLYGLYAQNMVTFTKPQVQYALLIDLALNKKMPEAQYTLGRELALRNWSSTSLGLRAKWDGAALVFRSYQKVKQEWLDFPLEKLSDQERDDLENREITYNPYWVLGPVL